MTTTTTREKKEKKTRIKNENTSLIAELIPEEKEIKKKRLRARSFVYYDIKAREKRKKTRKRITKPEEISAIIISSFSLSAKNEYNQVRFSRQNFPFAVYRFYYHSVRKGGVFTFFAAISREFFSAISPRTSVTVRPSGRHRRGHPPVGFDREGLT